jgi:hypothetical protein
MPRQDSISRPIAPVSYVGAPGQKKGSLEAQAVKKSNLSFLLVSEIQNMK